MLFFRPRLKSLIFLPFQAENILVLSFKKEENIMMILALQFWVFLLCCLDTVQTYDMYTSSYCHQLLTFGLRQCRFFRFVRQFYQFKKTDDISRRHQRFPPDLMSEKRLRRNSVLRTRHYPDLGSTSDWLKQVSQAALPTGRTTQI